MLQLKKQHEEKLLKKPENWSGKVIKRSCEKNASRQAGVMNSFNPHSKVRKHDLISSRIPFYPVREVVYVTGANHDYTGPRNLDTERG